jgi:hypothetical protein
MKPNAETLLATLVTIFTSREVWRFFTARMKAKEKHDESLSQEISMYRKELIVKVQAQSKEIIQRDKIETELQTKITNLSSALARMEEANKHLEKDINRLLKNQEINKTYIEELLRKKDE